MVLGQFGATAGKARDGYARFILDGIAEEHRQDFHSGTDDPRILGSDAFAEAALADGKRRGRRVSVEQVMEVVLGVYRIDREALRSASQQRRLAEARAMLAWLARESGAGNLEQVARIVNRDAGSLSSAVWRLVARAGEDAAVAGRLAGAKSALYELVDLEARYHCWKRKLAPEEALPVHIFPGRKATISLRERAHRQVGRLPPR